MNNPFGDYLNCILAGAVWGTFLFLTWLGFMAWRDLSDWQPPDDNADRFQKPGRSQSRREDDYDPTWNHTEFDKQWEVNHRE